MIFNCPFCNIQLEPSPTGGFHCPNPDMYVGINYHFYYDFMQHMMAAFNNEGNFAFTLNKDNEVTCAIFSTDNSGEKVWLTQEDEARREGCIIKYPHFSQIPKIIERFEISRTFK